MGIVSTVTSKGQTTVPKEIRDELGLEDGTKIEWRLENGEAVISARKLKAADLFGLLGKPARGKSSARRRDVVGDAVSRHVLDGDEGA